MRRFLIIFVIMLVTCGCPKSSWSRYTPSKDELIKSSDYSEVIFVGTLKYIGEDAHFQSGMAQAFQMCVYRVEYELKSKAFQCFMPETPIYHLIAGGRLNPEGTHLSKEIFKIGEKIIVFYRIGTPGLEEYANTKLPPGIVRVPISCNAYPYSQVIENDIVSILKEKDDATDNGDGKDKK